MQRSPFKESEFNSDYIEEHETYAQYFPTLQNDDNCSISDTTMR